MKRCNGFHKQSQADVFDNGKEDQPKAIEIPESKSQKRKSLKQNQKHYLNLPSFCNINPRSLYNKLSEFHTFVEQEELDCIFISESWERLDLPLTEVIKLKDFEIISNAFQRPNIGVLKLGNFT